MRAGECGILMPVSAMDGPHYSVSLFTRGHESVRILRLVNPTGPVRLLVHGPGSEAATYDLDDEVECVMWQSAIERNLVTEGFRLEPSLCERRSGRDRRGTARESDRRRWVSVPVV